MRRQTTTDELFRNFVAAAAMLAAVTALTGITVFAMGLWQ
jgi:hypothetical protein